MENNKNGSTNNTLLILILVIIVGFVVWYVTAHKQAPQDQQGVEINLGDNSAQ